MHCSTPELCSCRLLCHTTEFQADLITYSVRSYPDLLRVGWRLLGVSFDWHFLQGLKMSVAVIIKTLSLFTATKIHFYCPKYELFSVHRICTAKQYGTVCQKSGRPPIFSLMKHEQFILISGVGIIKLSKREWINSLVTDKRAMLYLGSEAQNLVLPTSFGLQHTAKPLKFLVYHHIPFTSCF